MAYGFRRGAGGNRDDVQGEGLLGVSGQANKSIQNGGRVSFEVLDPRAFLLHNAHIQSGKEPPKGCGLCRGQMENPVVQVASEVSGPAVDQGGGVDETESAASPRDSKLWPWEY